MKGCLNNGAEDLASTSRALVRGRTAPVQKRAFLGCLVTKGIRWPCSAGFHDIYHMYHGV